MNRNYKVIWNEASRCFVAVAEYAKTRGKSSGAVVSSHSKVSDSSGVVQSVPLFRLKALRSGLLAVGLSSLALGMSTQVSAAVGILGGTGSGTAISKCIGDGADSGDNPENIAIGCEAETSNVGLYIADRGNPYYTDNVTNASSVAAADRNAYTPRGEAGGAIAIGTGATTETTFGVALGDYAKTTEIAGVAIGVGTLAKGNTALAIGRQSAAIADYSQAIGNVAAATGKGALAVGHSAAATGYRAIAIGATDIESASESYGQPNANYQGNGQTKATADDTIAFGSGAAASAASAIAIGKSSTATRVGSVALGADANTATAANGVTSATVNGRTFGGFAGSTGISANDQVSIGTAGAERQIKNVAAGNVTTASTDAINGSQLFSVANTLGQDITNNATNITTNSDNIAKGVKFNVNGGERTYALGETIGVTTDSNIVTTPTTDGVNVALANTLNIGSMNPVTINGEDGTISGLTNTSFDDTATYTGGLAATQEQLSELNSNINNTVNQGLDFTGDNTLVTVNRKFGQKLTVKGGEDNTSNLTDNNIGVIADDSDGSLTVKLTKDLVGLNSADFGGVNISATGINANNTKITNVSDGTIAAGSTDAVNGGQLNTTNTAVNNNATNISTNTTAIGNNATNITTNSDNIAKGIKFNVNGGERTYALGETIGVTTDSNIVTTPTTDGVNVALANTLNIGSMNPVTINGEDGTISGLTNTSFDDTATYTGGLAATQEQLSELNSNINNTVNQGLDFTGDNTLVTVNRKFGQKLTVKGGEDNTSNLTDNNIGVIADDSDGSLTVKLTKDLVGLNSADFGGVNLSATGINANNTKITNVSDGIIAAGSTDAVNGGQLNAQGTGVKNIIGGDTVYNPATGSFTNTNIGGTGQSTIDEAIKTVTTSVTKAKTTVSQGDNIVVTETTNADGSTDYSVATAPDLAVDSVTTGNSTLNNNGLAIDDGTGNTTTITTAGTTVTNAAGNSASYGADGFSASDSAGNSTIVNQGGVSFTDSNGDATGPSITALGVDAGNTVITNVASGGDVASNAANIGDVQAAAAASKTQVAAGTNVSSVTKTLGAAGQDIYTVNANGTSVSAGSSAVSVIAGVKNANNVTDYAVDLSQATKNSLVSADNALQSVVTQIDGVDVKTINKTNNTANFVTGNNIVLSNDNGNIKVATAQDLTVTSITTGNTTVNNNGVTIEGGPSLTTNGINAGGQVITGVGAGTNATDAVNVGQLTNFNTAINNEFANIDRNLNDLGYRVGEVEDDANAGISAAMAMSSLPQSFIPGKSMMGGGIASYNGESAVAIGVSKVSDNGRWVIKLNGSADTQGNAGGSIGAGFHF